MGALWSCAAGVLVDTGAVQARPPSLALRGLPSLSVVLSKGMPRRKDSTIPSRDYRVWLFHSNSHKTNATYVPGKLV